MESIQQGNSKLQKRKKPITVRTEQATDYLFRGFFLLGINMPENDRYYYIVYSFIVNGIVTVFLPIAFTMSSMKMNAGQSKLKSLLSSVNITLDVWSTSVKIIIMAFYLKSLKSAHPVLEKLDERCVTPQELDHLNKIVKLGRRLVTLFFILYWSAFTCIFMGPVLNGNVPYSLYNPFFNWRDSRLFFVIQVLMEYSVVNVSNFQSILEDSYAVVYVCILRKHLQILIERIEKLATKDPSNCSKNFEELKMCIKDHKNLIEVYNTISPVISATIFAQFMTSATIIGTTLINMMVLTTDFASRFGSCAYILGIALQIFPLCYVSECLLQENERLTEAIFHCNWMEQDVKYRKTILVFMHHSQQRMEFKAGKLFPISLNSFVGIAKFSFSLYTFMREMSVN